MFLACGTRSAKGGQSCRCLSVYPLAVVLYVCVFPLLSERSEG